MTADPIVRGASSTTKRRRPRFKAVIRAVSWAMWNWKAVATATLGVTSVAMWIVVLVQSR